MTTYRLQYLAINRYWRNFTADGAYSIELMTLAEAESLAVFLHNAKLVNHPADSPLSWRVINSHGDFHYPKACIRGNHESYSLPT